MRLVEQHHTETALTDTTTDTQWQLVVQELLVEIEFLSIFLAFQLQLAKQALLVNTDTHGTQLEASAQYRIPDQDITIQSLLAILGYGAPVVIVRSTSIMLLSIAQLSADTLDKHGTVFLADSILTLLRSFVRIHIKQILRMDKMNLLWQERLQLWIVLASQELGAEDGCIDAANHIFKECDGAVFLGNHSLPVPLVHIERMKIIKFLIGTDGIHISIDTIVWLYLIFCQGQALPFSQRVNHLSLCITQILDRESHRALHSIQVVIDTQTLQYEERGGDTAQAQLCGQVLLEELFYHFDTHFGLAHIQQRLIPFGFYQITHFIYYISFIVSYFTVYLTFTLQRYKFIINLQAFFENISQNDSIF